MTFDQMSALGHEACSSLIILAEDPEKKKDTHVPENASFIAGILLDFRLTEPAAGDALAL